MIITDRDRNDAKGKEARGASAARVYDTAEQRPPRVESRRYVEDYFGVEREGEPRYLRISDFARITGSSSSYIKRLVDNNRIPEAFRAYRDEKDTNGRTLIPDRRCIIPTSRTNHGEGEDMKVADYLFHPDEVPRAWVDNPKVRPESGVILVGDESMPLGERIEATFGLPVGERSEYEIRSRPIAMPYTYGRHENIANDRAQLEGEIELLEADLEGLRSEDRWEDYIEAELDELPEAMLKVFEVDEEMKRKYFAADRDLLIKQKTERLEEIKKEIERMPEAVTPLVRRDRATLYRYGIDLNELENHPEITGVVVYFRDTNERSVRDIDGVDVISVER